MRIYPIIIASCAALLFSSCASVSVREVNRDEQSSQPSRPVQFVIEPFAVDRAHLKENPARKHPGQLDAECHALLEAALVQELAKLGVPTTPGTGSGRAGNIWVVSGTITRVEEGNRFLRMGIGLGMGGTKMETAVSVRTAGAAQPFLHFGTTGGSNATPGALTTPVPFSGTAMALFNSKDGVTADAARTARMIAATIADYMAQQGWLSGNHPKPKLAR